MSAQYITPNKDKVNKAHLFEVLWQEMLMLLVMVSELGGLARQQQQLPLHADVGEAAARHDQADDGADLHSGQVG